jgi:hypothetical protein
MCDPPSGWVYGFPKPIPEDRRKDVTVWLIEEGYPKNLIEELGEYFYCRYWEQPKEKLVVKYNNGNGAILCSECRVIIKTGKDYTEEERQYAVGDLEYLPPQFCETCKQKENEDSVIS